MRLRLLGMKKKKQENKFSISILFAVDIFKNIFCESHVILHVRHFFIVEVTTFKKQEKEDQHRLTQFYNI